MYNNNNQNDMLDLAGWNYFTNICDETLISTVGAVKLIFCCSVHSEIVEFTVYTNRYFGRRQRHSVLL